MPLEYLTFTHVVTYSPLSAVLEVLQASLIKKTARLGNALGMTGVAGGLTTALAQLSLPMPVFTQAMALLGTSAAIGSTIGNRVAVTELP